MQKKNEKQQMFQLIEQWKSSGQSQAAWCKEAGMAYHIFHYWYKVYRDEQHNSEQTAAFVALQIKPAAVCPTPYAEVIAPNGKRLVFHREVDAQLLQLLLR